MKLWQGLILIVISGVANATPDIATRLPQDCQVAGTQNVIDLGELNRPRNEKLSPRKMSVSVSCRYPVPMLLSISGEQAGNDFRLADGGRLNVTLDNARLDNRAVSLRSESSPAGRNARWLKATPGMRFLPDGDRNAGRLLTFDLTVQPLMEYGQASREKQTPSARIVLTLE